MKNLFFILVLFIGFTASAQEIPAKANTITITLPDSSGINDKIQKVFSSKDYTTGQAKGTSTIHTNPKTLKNNTRITLYARPQGADVILTGKIVIAGQSNMPIEYKGAKGSNSMIAWEEMEKVAKAFGGKIKYEVK